MEGELHTKKNIRREKLQGEREKEGAVTERKKERAVIENKKIELERKAFLNREKSQIKHSQSVTP